MGSATSGANPPGSDDDTASAGADVRRTEGLSRANSRTFPIIAARAESPAGGSRGAGDGAALDVHAGLRTERTTLVDELRGPARGDEARDCCLLTVLSGERAGTVLAVPRDGLYVGRGADVDASFDDPFLSRRHARLFWDLSGVYVDDLGTTNGTYVGKLRITGPARLCDGDEVLVGHDTLLRCSMHDAHSEEAALRLYASTIEDPVTGAHNRRYLEGRLESEMTFARRRHAELSLIVFDVDGLKATNDAFGHAAGDGVLRVVVAAVRRVLRPEDVLARLGGDEFVVLGGGVSARNAEILGERIRRAVGALSLRSAGNEIHSTVSVGVASWRAPTPCEAADLLAAADGAMYQGKHAGGNRAVAVVVE